MIGGRRVFFIGNIGGVVLRLRDVMMIEVFKLNLCGPKLLPTIEAWPLIVHVAFIMC